MLNLPETGALVQEFSSLFGQEVKVKQLGAALPPSQEAAVFVYNTKDGAPGVLGVCDFAWANYSGAALALIPAKTARDAIALRAVSDEILMNCREVMNVLAGLLNLSSSEHLVLKEIYGPGQPRPPAVAPVLSRPVKYASYEIGLEGYGTGVMCLILVA